MAARRLPASRDAFVGRVQELTDIGLLLRRARLVSLVGTGGAGKTRLATEYATRAVATYPDGVWIVELAPLTSDHLLAQTIASALGVREQAGEDLVDTVVLALQGKRALLVIDNCEHLVDASASLADALLTGCPQLRVLVTSRESLDLPGEAVLRVGHLSLPDSSQRSEAVQLFVERARLLRPDFELTDANRPVVAEICMRLDGMPLAIELAARWVRVLSVEEILARLDDRFELLSRGPRTAATRHRDLRATIEWSYELLDDTEREALRRLSVLAGDFSLDSASAVCGVGPQRTLRLLADLDAKSLVVAVPGMVQRFRQLESIRLYAREKLAEAGEVDDTTERLVGWLTSLGESHYVDQMLLTVYDDGPKVDDERDNLLQAVEWTTARRDERLAVLAAALGGAWRRQGHTVQIRKLLEAALTITKADNPYRSLALIELGWFNVTAGDFERARDLAVEAMALEEPRDRPVVLGRNMTLLSMVYQALGDVERSTRCAERCVELVRPLGRPLDTAVGMHNLGYGAMAGGDPARAAELIEECLPVYMELADPVKQMEILHSAGGIALERGKIDQAGDYFRRSVEVCPAAGEPATYPVEGLAIVAALTGEPKRALLLGTAMATQLRKWRMRREPFWQRHVDAAMATARASLSAQAAREATEAGERMTLAQAIAYALRTPVADDDDSPLSQREWDVAMLTAEGLTNREIAVRLSISERTVETHLLHIRTKLDLRTRAQVAAWAVEQGRVSSRP
ncbi:LuxR C-terminal-related transcriptional regulator [Kutzneria kofuensis]|uniref:Putative ATPase/DNA-binding CsgD family transcriptional regulator n=2 Tax=Kutzneria kofuensis TaxID=103725 RepID=A0A7W9KB90_9PSEU|nr:LuxR C-terminal-related transcriptional regulator [Kutzneria kofuensis]MBB5889346.1 putative ATPase/DNA-binding CsgD family transcriptional regulator [Kutzneria kofuensis]